MVTIHPSQTMLVYPATKWEGERMGIALVEQVLPCIILQQGYMSLSAAY